MGVLDVKDIEYECTSVEMPHLMGAPLRVFTSLLEGSFQGLLAPGLLKSAGIAEFRERTFLEEPTLYPEHRIKEPAPFGKRVGLDEWPALAGYRPNGFRFPGVDDYARAYREGIITPEEVAQRVLDAIQAADQDDPPLKAFIAVDRQDVLKQAEESAQRFKSGQALGVLDGVPVAVKDEVDMLPYPTTVGTAYLGTSPAKDDSTVVARLRAAGALLIGKTNMHEVGIGVTGLNPHHGTPRNPYNPNHFTGGSSSGSAAAVASGLCPFAIGADGGGSIRIPSAFCGLVGIKSTFGRVSEYGAAPLAWSVAHLGPLAGRVSDAALAYAVIAGPDPRDVYSTTQPAPTLHGWNNIDLTGLKIGVFDPWYCHASDEVFSACENMMETFKGAGANVLEVPIPDLEAARVAHVITIGAEIKTALGHAYEEHYREAGLDVRTNMALIRHFNSCDYINSQRVRTRMMANFKRAFEDVDVIITPTTAITAPPIPPGALPDGESDLSNVLEIIRFAAVANLTGLPAISFPVGYSEAGLPIGMQAIGRAWDEPTLLRLALVAEGALERQAPMLFFDILK